MAIYPHKHSAAISSNPPPSAILAAIRSRSSGLNGLPRRDPLISNTLTDTANLLWIDHNNILLQ